MRKWYIGCLFFWVNIFFSTAQIKEDASLKTKEIEQYIDHINNTVNFAAETSTGTVTKPDGKVIDYSLTYYAAGPDDLFSIVYQEFDILSVNKVFYYKEGKVIFIVVEEIDTQKEGDRLVNQVIYYFEDEAVINTENEQEKYTSEALVKEAEERRQQFLAL